MKSLFYKGAIDKRNGKALWKFLKEHFTYYTLNSWNGLQSIANNVKIYNLGLEGDKWLALGLLQQDEYNEFTAIVEQFEDKYPHVRVFSNGRSSGYLVLGNKDDNGNVLPDWIIDNYDYDDFKQTCKDYYGSVKEALPDLIEYVELVQDFDKLCDQLREYVNELSLTNKEELAESELEGLVEEFNDNYEQDLNNLQIEELEVNKDEKGFYINTHKLNKSNSLSDCFHDLLQRFNNALSLFAYKYENDLLRLEYIG